MSTGRHPYLVEEVRDEDSHVRGGRVGSRIVDEALHRGHEVTAVVRDPSRFGADRDGLRVVAGDVTDTESVAAAIAGHDAVVNAVAPTGGQSPEMFSEAAHALLDGLPRTGVRRLVVVGGGGSLEVSPGVRLIDTPAFEEFPEEWKPGVLAQGGAILAFAAVEAAVSGGFRHGLEDEPSRVRALGSSISFLSVGLALLVALVVGRLAGDLLAWALGSFFATVAYLLVFAFEIALAERLRRRRSD